MHLRNLLTLATILVGPLSRTTARYINDPSLYNNVSFSFDDDYLTEWEDEFGVHRSVRRWDYPNAASDDVWNRAIGNGKNLLEAIRGTDREAAERYQPPPESMTVQSKFEDFPKELIDWGWHQYDAVHINERAGWMDWHGWGIADALKGLKVSDKVVDDDDGKMLVPWMHHGQPWDDEGNMRQVKDGDGNLHDVDVKKEKYGNGGIEYPYTDARFVYAVNTAEGVILCLDIKGPHQSAPDLPRSELPAVRTGSDIMYGVWKWMLGLDKTSNKAADSLRYYGIVSITNEDTRGIIVRAVEDEDDRYNGVFKITEWPGLVFNPGVDGNNQEFLALLGSPTAQALGYMLVQRKATMGKLRIVGVHVFLCNSETEGQVRMACMIWLLKNEPPTPPTMRRRGKGL